MRVGRHGKGRGCGPRAARRMAVALGVAAALLAGVEARAADSARSTRTIVRTLRDAVEQHRRVTGELPRDGRQLGVVARLYAPQVRQTSGVPVDAWGRAIVFGPRGDGAEPGYRLYSVGANGRDEAGGGDDLAPPRPPKPGEPDPVRAIEPALRLLPALSLLVVGPIGWGVLRAARRAALGG